MKILLTNLEGGIYPIDVSPDLEIMNLKALCEQETGIALAEMSLSHNGQILSDEAKSLEGYSIKENDIIMVQKLVSSQLPPAAALIDFSSIAVPTGRPSSSSTSAGTSRQQQQQLAGLLQSIISDPYKYEIVKQRYPELARALERNDPVKVMQLLNQLMARGGAGAGGLFNESSSNPFDAETQRRIAEEIRLQNVQQNMESALEYMPEAFGNVVMLYINCKVNGHHVKAFVDSGAQMTIMSAACAERCDIMRLVDTRWMGVAKGVGTQKIVGRVHIAQIQIEKAFLTTSFSILEQQQMDMLLGLDILKRHQCIIDLERNMLVIKAQNVETSFLPEAELPSFARLNYDHSQDEATPAALPSGSSTTTSQQPTTSTSSTKATPLPSSTSSRYSDTTISNLMQLGASREQVIEALDSTNGDEMSAQVVLLAKLIQVPAAKKK